MESFAYDPGVERRGLEHLDHHVRCVRTFGFEPVIAVNYFDGDTKADLQAIEDGCRDRGLTAARFTGFADGGAGAADLAQAVVDAAARRKSCGFTWGG